MALIHLHFPSKALEMETACDVILPQGRSDTHAPFPVLWLLHGMTEDHTAWQRHTGIERYLAEYGMAAVMPDAHLSCYADMAHGGKFFTYIAEELPEAMRRFFPLSQRREDSFIAGLSMGGMGSLKIGLSHPDRYAAIGCLSAGYTNYRPLPPAQVRMRAEVYRLAYGDGGALESESRTAEQARRIVREGLPAPRVYHCCGQNDILRENARQTQALFESFEGNPFDYLFEQPPGIHDWAFWDAQIQRFLIYIFKGRGGLSQ